MDIGFRGFRGFGGRRFMQEVRATLCRVNHSRTLFLFLVLSVVDAVLDQLA